MINRPYDPRTQSPDTEIKSDLSPSMRSDVQRDFPLVQQFDPRSRDLVTAHKMAYEFIYVAGAVVEIFARTDNADVDKVWGEDPDPTYWPGVVRKGFFQQKPLELALKQWSLEASITLVIDFSKDDMVRHFGQRMLRSGDVILVPYNSIGNITPKYFSVENASPSNPYRYDMLYLTCTCQNISGDITINPMRRPTTGEPRV